MIASVSMAGPLKRAGFASGYNFLTQGANSPLVTNPQPVACSIKRKARALCSSSDCNSASPSRIRPSPTVECACAASFSEDSPAAFTAANNSAVDKGLGAAKIRASRTCASVISISLNALQLNFPKRPLLHRLKLLETDQFQDR